MDQVKWLCIDETRVDEVLKGEFFQGALDRMMAEKNGCIEISLLRGPTAAEKRQKQNMIYL